MLDIEETLQNKFPKMDSTFKGRLTKKIIKHFAHEAEINAFIAQNPHLEGRAFIQKAFEHLNFSYHISAASLNNIPSQGRVIIVANHPIGTLDGLALLEMVKGIRPDVKVLANELLQAISPLRQSFFPINNMSAKASHKTQFKAMTDALEADEAVIIFPAGVVSRLGGFSIQDGEWKTGFLKLAQKTHSPILPLHIQARNSALFYGASLIYKPLSTLLLMNEMFTKNGKTIGFKTGKLIPCQAMKQLDLPMHELADRVKRHVYHLKQGNASQPLFETVETISHPSCRQGIRNDLKKANHLLTTPTGLDLYLVDYVADSALMQELGRVRELTFRAVGEGTGTCWDLDQYDRHYQHLILWDDKRLEIAGGYRLGNCRDLIAQYGKDSLYANHMFTLGADMDQYLDNALELGRCFVQPNYWGTRALDYLWYGMGNYLSKHPDVQYLFGSISLSNSYSEEARQLIVSFYNTQFGTDQDIAQAKCPFEVSQDIQNLAQQEFTGDYRSCFARLNERLEALGERLPMLFKQYVDLCDDKGCTFIDFNVAPDFNNCIGSLMMVEVAKIKKSKHRYLKGFDSSVTA